jgi:hypothetical protein
MTDPVYKQESSAPELPVRFIRQKRIYPCGKAESIASVRVKTP